MSALDPIDIRIGKVIRAEPNLRAKKPAYCLWIDFGELGVKTSSAQLTDYYTPEDLVGRNIASAVNLGSRLIAGFKSECLVLGVVDSGGVRLLAVDGDVAPGSPVS